MRYRVRFYSLSGKFTTVRRETFDSYAIAFNVLTQNAAAVGFTNFKAIDDDGVGDYRVTATTPGGRHGRNIGTIEPIDEWTEGV